MTIATITYRATIFVLGLELQLVGCARTDRGPTSPTVIDQPVQQKQLHLVSRQLTVSCLGPGETISPGPTVVVTDDSGHARPRVAVRFTVVTGGGTLADSVVVSNELGVATVGSWRMGSDIGSNVVTAELENGPNSGRVYFFVDAAPTGKVVAAYRLVTIGGRPLPQTYSGGGTSWTITGGHYYLADNGTYAFGYEFAATDIPATICSASQYVSQSDTIDLYLARGSYPGSQFYGDRAGHFARAVLVGPEMTVEYEDLMDYEKETYQIVPRVGS